MRTFGLSLGVIVFGFLVLWINTNGLQTFTAESQRRLSLSLNPRALPPLPLIDTDGNQVTLSRPRGKVTLVDFIYTRCLTLCRQQSILFESLSEAITAKTLTDKVQLLSISFDPHYDNLSALKSFAGQFNAQSPLWRFARLKQTDDLNQLLKIFGITVIPDGLGGFEHNAGIHVINKNGAFEAVYDFDDAAVLKKVLGSAKIRTSQKSRLSLNNNELQQHLAAQKEPL